MKSDILRLLALFFALAIPANAKPPVKVFILAGQSNMEGAGKVEGDPKRNGGKGRPRRFSALPKNRHPGRATTGTATPKPTTSSASRWAMR